MSTVRLLVDLFAAGFVRGYGDGLVEREHRRMFRTVSEARPPWVHRYCAARFCPSCAPYRHARRLELRFEHEARRRRLSVAFASPMVFTVADVHAVACASAASSRLELDKHDGEIEASYERAQLRTHAWAGEK